MMMIPCPFDEYRVPARARLMFQVWLLADVLNGVSRVVC